MDGASRPVVRIVDWAFAAHDPLEPAAEGAEPVPGSTAASHRRWFPAVRAVGRALAVLRARGHLRGGGTGLAVVLATDSGDRPALVPRVDTVLALAEGLAPAPRDLFRAIARFPAGHLLKSVCDAAGARGPAFAVPGGDGLLPLVLATDLVRSGRATATLACFVEPVGAARPRAGAAPPTGTVAVLLECGPGGGFPILEALHGAGGAPAPLRRMMSALGRPAGMSAVPGLVDLDACGVEREAPSGGLHAVRRLTEALQAGVQAGPVLFAARRRAGGATGLWVGTGAGAPAPPVDHGAPVVVTGAAAFESRARAAAALERLHAGGADGCSPAPGGAAGEMDCAAFLGAVVQAALADAAIAGVRGPRVGLVAASFLGNAPAAAYAAARGGTPVPGLDAQVVRLARRLGLSGPRFLVSGVMGASMVALALAADLLRLGRADAVVVCGAEVLDAAVDAALGVLRCTDRPEMADGAAAVVLERRDCATARGAAPRRRLAAVELVSPAVRLQSLGEVDPDWPGLARLRALRPARVEVSGGTALDLAVSAELVRRLWGSAAGQACTPDADARRRRLGADAVFRLALTHSGEPVRAVVSVSGFGGCGVLVTAPEKPHSAGADAGGQFFNGG